jgi:hypothetical protein
LANHHVNDDYDAEDYSMLGSTISSSEKSESKDDDFMFGSINNDNHDEDKFSEMDQCFGDYTRRHSLRSGYNLRPHVSSRSNVFWNEWDADGADKFMLGYIDNKNDGDDELSERVESSGYVDNDDGADKSVLGYIENKNDRERPIE